MHRYSHYIYWHINKQNRLLCCKPPDFFPEGLILPVVTSGQARRLRRHCLVPLRVIFSSRPSLKASMYRLQWPCCIWSLLHVEPLHICDLPAATLKLLSPLSSFAPAFLSLPLSAPQIKSSTCHHKCAQASPLCSVYSLPVFISIADHPVNNGLHRRDDHVLWPLGRRGA